MRVSSTLTSLTLVLVLLFTISVAAQPGVQSDESKIKLLRTNIQRMVENAPPKDAPEEGEYRDTLLSLRSQLRELLVERRGALKSRIQGLDAPDSLPEVMAHVQKLRNELERVNDEIQKLGSDKTGGAGDLIVSGSSPHIPVTAPASSMMARPRASTIEPSMSASVSAASPSEPAAAPPSDVQNCPTANKFDDPPPALADVARRIATNIVLPPDPSLTADERLDELSSGLFEMIFYSVAEAVAPAAGDSIMNLEPYRYLYETARTDKQLSSSASSSSSTSAIDKPGFASWLGVGIENGQIEQAVGVDGRDTVLTLSTSPVVLFSFNKSRAEAYKQAGIFNRLGISASFNINDQSQLLANARRSQLREYSVRYRFLGDRSPRSPKLENIFDTKIAPVIQARLRALGTAFTAIDDVLPTESTRMRGELRTVVSERMKSAEFIAKVDSAHPEKQIEDLRDTILCYFKTAVVDRVKGGSLTIDAATKDNINNNLVPALIAAHKKMELVRDVLTDELDNFFKGPIGTLAYVNHRSPAGSDYSEAKFLYEHNSTPLKPLKFIANAGLSFYHRPIPELNQQRLRDIAAAIAFEGKMTSPFTETENLGQITFSFVGRYERMFENRHIDGRKADIASVQFLTDIPLFKGLAFPFSLTYSNATEVDRKKGWRANFAFKLDTDKLLDILRTASKQ